MRRQIITTSTFCFLALFGLTAGCLSNLTPSNTRSLEQTPATAANAPATSQALAAAARVASNWQIVMFDQLRDSSASEAWGLFSSSGWVDSGQVYVLGDDANPLRVTKVPPAGSEAGPTTSLNETQAKTFLSQVNKANTLADYTPNVYDAVKYEYVHAIKTASGDVKILHRLYMVNISVARKKEVAEHKKLVEVFQSL